MVTIIRTGEASLRVRRSRFLAFAWPAGQTSEVQRALDELSRRYHDARHIAYAFRLQRTGEERAHDAGEPAGSAGTAIMHFLQGEQLWDVAVAVARYFGGVKLGVGNLTRAYRSAARRALDQAGRRPLVPVTRAVVVVRPELLGMVFCEVGRRGLRVAGQRVTDHAEVELVLPTEELDALREALDPWAQVREED